MPALFLFLISLVSLLAPGVSSAAAPAVAGDSAGKTVTYNLAAGDSSTTEVHFYYVSRGSIFVPVEIVLSGPAGLKATLEQKKLAGSIPKALSESKGWTAVPTATKLEIKAAAAQALMNKTISCSDIPDSIYREELEKRGLPDNSVTRTIICRILQLEDGTTPTPGPNPGPGPGPGSYVTGSGIVKKNTCTEDKNTRYLVRLKVSLAQVSAENTAAGYSISASFAERAWTGSRAASIKPTSDGKFAPRPIVMMVAMYGDTGINVYASRKSKLSFMRRLPVSSWDNFGRMGQMFSRTDVSPVLRGGKGVFEMTNGAASYSVCFNLVRSRQRVGGFR